MIVHKAKFMKVEPYLLQVETTLQEVGQKHNGHHTILCFIFHLPMNTVMFTSGIAHTKTYTNVVNNVKQKW